MLRVVYITLVVVASLFCASLRVAAYSQDSAADGPPCCCFTAVDDFVAVAADYSIASDARLIRLHESRMLKDVEIVDFEIKKTEVTQGEWAHTMCNHEGVNDYYAELVATNPAMGTDELQAALAAYCAPAVHQQRRHCEQDHKVVTVTASHPEGAAGDIEFKLSLCRFNPVENVSWLDVGRFIDRLNERCESSGFVYRLPYMLELWIATEASRVSIETDKKAAQFGWYRLNSNDHTHPVARLAPQRIGRLDQPIYDFFGNVWEWMQDGVRNPISEPLGSLPDFVESGAHKFVGGMGAFDSLSMNVTRLQMRKGDYKAPNLGFRPVRLPKE